MRQSKRRMKRSIGYGLELHVIADPGVRVIEPVINMLERYIKWCRNSTHSWQYDGGQGSGREVRRRWIYYMHVGPKTCALEDFLPYAARIQAMLPVLEMAMRVKSAGGDLEELRDEMKRVCRDKAKAGGKHG